MKKCEDCNGTGVLHYEDNNCCMTCHGVGLLPDSSAGYTAVLGWVRDGLAKIWGRVKRKDCVKCRYIGYYTDLHGWPAEHCTKLKKSIDPVPQPVCNRFTWWWKFWIGV